MLPFGSRPSIRLAGLPNRWHGCSTTRRLGAFARQDQRADATGGSAWPEPAEFEMGVAGHRVDHDPFAVQYVLALADHDISGQRDRLLLQIVDAEIAARILVLGDDGDAAARLDPADILRALAASPGAARPAVRSPAAAVGCWRRLGLRSPDAMLRPVEDNERLALMVVSPCTTCTSPENVAIFSLSCTSSVAASI